MPTHRYSDGYRARRSADPARRIAWEVLTQVREEDSYANLVLPKLLRTARQEEGLSSRDAAFASEITYGTLRELGYLDWVIARHVNRPLEELDGRVLDLLRIGAYQLLKMRVPDHAAVSETVDLARNVVTQGPASMVNAVLRSITRESEEDRSRALAAIEDPHERLAIETSHPRWMVDEYARALEANGCQNDELEALLRANNEAPLVTLVARYSFLSVDDLRDEAEDRLRTRTAAGEVSPRAVLIESGDPAALPSVRAGAAGVQDEGSQLAALLAVHTPLEGSDESWLDLCAGPGGKAALIASYAREKGAHLVANEYHPHRARLVARSTRLMPDVNVVSGDGRTFGGEGTRWPLGSFDRVIVDAPCTGLGSMRRRPESRWRRRPEDVTELVGLQEQLLTRAVELLRPGGVLTYVTCSPHVDETHAQVEKLLSGGSLELLDTPALAATVTPLPLDLPEAGKAIGGRGSAPAGAVLQLWEHRHETDLMFIAVFRKKMDS